MLKSIVEFIKGIFDNPVMTNNLEAYIVAGQPKTADDIERLEREFLVQRKHLCRYCNE